jgi:hypothetical protein
MTLARLLAAALVVCSLPALAQDQRPLTQEELFRGGRFFFVRPDPAATPAEPWRVFSDWTADLRSGQNALDPRRLDHIKLDRIKSDPQVRRFKSQLRGCSRLQGFRFHASGGLFDLPTSRALPGKDHRDAVGYAIPLSGAA